jgi:O-antigen/teichoic acid export membrane protein
MTEDVREKYRRATFRDAGLTVLLGPLRYIVPIVAYLFLYPLILSKSGAEVLGIWSLLGAVASFITFADIGFSTLLAREAGRDRTPADLKLIYADYLAAQRAYVALMLLLILAFNLLASQILAPLETVYSLGSLRVSVTLILLGVMIQLMAKLDASILSARQDNYMVQTVAIVAPTFLFSAAVAGAVVMRPVEGLAVGTVLSGLVMIAAYRWRLSRRHPEWRSGRFPMSWREALSKVLNLTRRGWHLYSISVGMLLREPLFRFVIAFALGLQAVAVYDIAMRVTRSARDAVATGFRVLYPSFAYFHRTGERDRTIELAQLSLFVLLPLGTAGLGLLIGAADLLMSLWLRDLPDQLVRATQILAVWNIVTLANVPFWFLLQATHNERAAAFSLWAHTGCILLVIPLSQLVRFDLPGLLVYWTATALLTQVLIYTHVHMRLSLFWPVVFRPRLVTLYAMSLAFVSVAFLVAARGHPSLGQPLLYLVVSLVAFLSGATAIVWSPLLGFVRSSRGDKRPAVNAGRKLPTSGG